MTNRPHRFQKTLTKSVPTVAPAPPAVVNFLSLDQLTYYGHGWLVDCEIRQHSPATRATRRLILDKLLWYLRSQALSCCGTSELRGFFSYLINGHTEDGGRWGNPQMTRPIRPRTVDTYHGHLRTFFSWVIAQGPLSASPMALISAPVCRADQIQPFTPDQVESLLAAARHTQQPRRDEAMVMLLIDTGVRASELCGLKHRDLDLTEKRITVLGKGGKKRTIYFGQRATKALWSYLGGKPVDADAPLFPSERASAKGDHLSRFGLRDMIGRLEEKSGVTGVRVSAHTFRHTFAVSFLRGGGQVYALKEIMGHTDLKMTLKYVALAEADLASQRRFSPGDQLTGNGPAARPRTWAKGKAQPEKAAESLDGKNAGEGKSGEVGNQARPNQVQKINRAKLTEEQVRVIKTELLAQDGRTETEKRLALARRYGVALATVKEIALGYSWSHVDAQSPLP